MGSRNGNPKTLAEAIELYFAAIDLIYSPEQAQRIKNELYTALRRYTLTEMGLQISTSSKRMTKAEIETAEALLRRLPLRGLLKLNTLTKLAFDNQNVSTAVRNTFGARVRQFVKSCRTEIWFPRNEGDKSSRISDECADPIPFKYGKTKETILMPHKCGSMPKYALKKQDISAQLKYEMEQFSLFCSSPLYIHRVGTTIEQSTTDGILYTIRLIFGWWSTYYNPLLPLDQLSLAILVPKITDEELEGLSSKQQKHLWREQKDNFKRWVLAYFEFLADEMRSFSPRTKASRLAQIRKIIQFQYASEVEDLEEYRQLPLMAALRDLQREVRAQAEAWNNSRVYVADQNKKWPDVPPGKSARMELIDGLFQHIRRRCRPRSSAEVFHTAFAQAKFYATFLMWTEVLLEPPRRQEEIRTRRIALACPIQRPESVPADGLWQPLPPDEAREYRQDGLISDNYLYRTYEYKGQRYPEGIWIKQISKYKTRRYYGPQNIIIRNRPLGDGLTLYDYLEQYLYGTWYIGNLVTAKPYTGWNQDLQGTRGRWLTKGRAEFESPVYWGSSPAAGDWPWGILFPVPQTGKQHTSTSLSNLFATSSHTWIGKRITPHMLRHVWATWAFQLNLTDAQIHSLAYAMGTSYKMLLQWYERSTPEDKRKAIEEVIDDTFLDLLSQIEDESGEDLSPDVRRVMVLAHQLNPHDKKRLTTWLQSD